MINLETAYVNVEPADADYPLGSFKNSSAPGALDGTPLEKNWANNFLGFMCAALEKAGIAASGVAETAQESQVLQALESLMWSPGDYKWCAYSTPGAGWLEAAGGSIGNAASGGTVRANNDTFALFARLWAEAEYVIQTSAGGAAARGSTAELDFAANKRIVLPDTRGCFPRGWDHGRGLDAARTLGSFQNHQFQDHTHGGVVDNMGDADSGAAQSTTTFTKLANTGTASSGNHGAETRPVNISGMFVIKY